MRHQVLPPSFFQQAAAGMGLGADPGSSGVVAKYSTKIGYMGLNKAGDKLTAEMLASSGAGGGGVMQSYAMQVGTTGGAALCAPYGPVASMMCSKAGGLIAGIIGGKLFGGSQVAPDQLTSSVWDKQIVPRVREAQYAIAAVRGYLTQRDALLDKVAGILNYQPADTSRAWASEWLRTHGLPAAPIDKNWWPRQDHWDTFVEFDGWSSTAYTYPGFACPGCGNTNTYHDWGARVGWDKLGYIWSPYAFDSFEWHNYPGPGGQVPLAGKLQQSAGAVLTTWYYPGGAPARTDGGIDWGMIGACQIVASTQFNSANVPRYLGVPNKFSPNGYTTIANPRFTAISLAKLNEIRPAGIMTAEVFARYTKTPLAQISKGYHDARYFITVDPLNPPIKVATQLGLSLDGQQGALIAAAQKIRANKLAGKPTPPMPDPHSKTMMVLGLGILAAGGYTAYRLWKK